MLPLLPGWAGHLPVLTVLVAFNSHPWRLEFELQALYVPRFAHQAEAAGLPLSCAKLGCPKVLCLAPLLVPG